VSTVAEETVCYRHPDRETAVQCSNCARPICTECMTSTPVGMRCPECSKQTTQVRTLRSVQQHATQVTRIIIGICVVVFLGELATERVAFPDSVYWRGGVAAVFVADGEWWRLLTAGFLHAEPPFGFLHLGFNMYLLWILGGMLEGTLGRWRFLLVYLVAIAGGSAAAMLIQPGAFSVGASGGVFGLMGAALLDLRSRGYAPFQSQIGQLLILNLVLTFVFPSVSIGGHLGGLAAGALAFLLTQETTRRRLPQPVALVALGALLAALLVAGVVVAGSVNPLS
jgi:membrane associated rhomboid family serine protease